MKSIIISTLVVFFIVASSFQAFAEEWTTEQKEVWDAVTGRWESIKKGDVEAFMNDFHDKNIDLYSDDPSTLNKNQIENSVKWMISNLVPTYINLKPIAINIVNNVANVFYIYKWESKNREISERGRRMTTMIKENNKWLSIGTLSASCDKPAPCPYGW